MAKKPEEFPERMTLTEACKYLRISFTKLTTLVHSGAISYETSPLDHRVKLVRRADLDELLRRAARK
jgi:excisionase family DNA binding protein